MYIYFTVCTGCKELYFKSYGEEGTIHLLISQITLHFMKYMNWEGTQLSPKFQINHEHLQCRVFNTHLRWELMPKGRSCKYIYVYRNGKDACTSFFHHLSNQVDSGPYEGTFDSFVKDWIDNKIIFGGWIAHLKSWITAAQNSENNILLVRYEDMKTDLAGSLKRISAYLGCRVDDEFILNRILPFVTFDHMREHIHQYEPVSVQWRPGFSFIRKGEIGDHVGLFTEEHESLFNCMLEKEFPAGLPSWLDQSLLR